jgi:MFS family permease
VKRFEGFANIAHTLRNPTYRIYIGGKFSAQVTLWMYRLALSWIVWDMTHSPAWLGIFGFLDHAPSILISPFAGALADRVDRMKLLRLTQALLLIHGLLLSTLIMADFLNIWLLAGFTLYFGIVVAIQVPASQSVVPNLVSRDVLPTAYGINSLCMNTSRFIGPMLAGLIISVWGAGEAIFGTVIGLGIFSICLAVMKVDIREGGKKSHQHMTRDIWEGFQYARGHAGIGPMFVMLIMLAVFTFPILQLMPSFAGGVFDAGPTGLSLMIALYSTGALLQAVYLAQRGGITGLTGYILKMILIMGAGLVLLTSTDVFWFGLVSVFIVGFATSADKVGSLTLVQYAVHGDMRGRIAAFYAMIFHGGPALGSLLLGFAAEHVGIRPTIATVGVLTIAIFLWANWKKTTMAPALEREDKGTLVGGRVVSEAPAEEPASEPVRQPSAAQ